MQEESLIPATDFCTHHRIEVSLLHSLHEYGLVEIEQRDEEVFIPASQLSELEKLLRLHSELDINLEGLDVIHHLLDKMNQMHNELTSIKNRLRFYEDFKEKKEAFHDAS